MNPIQIYINRVVCGVHAPLVAALLLHADSKVLAFSLCRPPEMADDDAHHVTCRGVPVHKKNVCSGDHSTGNCRVDNNTGESLATLSDSDWCAHTQQPVHTLVDNFCIAGEAVRYA